MEIDWRTLRLATVRENVVPRSSSVITENRNQMVNLRSRPGLLP